MGFCTLPWQLVDLRGLMGLVHFGGFISVISLGELVDEESRNEGMAIVKCDDLSSEHSFLLASCRKRNRGNVRLGHRRVPLRAVWASLFTFWHQVLPGQAIRRSWHRTTRPKYTCQRDCDDCHTGGV
jgi:hypothetical protein